MLVMYRHFSNSSIYFQTQVDFYLDFESLGQELSCDTCQQALVCDVVLAYY